MRMRKRCPLGLCNRRRSSFHSAAAAAHPSRSRRRKGNPPRATVLRRCEFAKLGDMDPSARRRALVLRGSALVVIVTAWLFVKFRCRSLARPSITYGPMSERDRVRQESLRFIYDSDDTKCDDLLRMKRAPFFQLCDLFRTRGLLRDSIHSQIEEQVAMFLHVVGHNQRFRCINLTFRSLSKLLAATSKRSSLLLASSEMK